MKFIGWFLTLIGIALFMLFIASLSGHGTTALGPWILPTTLFGGILFFVSGIRLARRSSC